MGTATATQGYHYKTGDRPLDGYTVQRGVGRGAFGEVYYALSDSGREVAIKCILGYEQIELRGVTQCMNLKSPHLVSIFDIRRNEAGQNFVIMEYVAGPSLRELLDESPSGLGPQKTAFFLREIAKGLSYLHDRGIVHRDLKPGNIFYEDGYVKIGDYGLSKAMTPSQHSGQTITVGTVHYMAPEIGRGCYDKSIDIYAMGVLVYELLTGHVPFFGASHGEVLMKHLVEQPDLSGIEEPFVTVIRKAMAKEPADRYQSVQEMVEAVFGAEHISQSVSAFRPETLSVVAERAARNVVGTGGTGSSADLPRALNDDRPAAKGDSDVWVGFGQKLDQAVTRLGEAGQRILSSGERLGSPWTARRPVPPALPAVASDASLDAMTDRQRWILATLVAIVVAVGTSTLSNDLARMPFASVFVVSAIWGAASGLWLAHRQLLCNSNETGIVRRVAYGAPAILGCVALSGLVLLVISIPWTSRPQPLSLPIGATYLAVLVSLLFTRWDKCLAARRQERVILRYVTAASLIGWIMATVLDGVPLMAMGIMAGVSLVVQMIAPFASLSSPRVNATAPASQASANRSPVGPPPLRTGGTREDGPIRPSLSPTDHAAERAPAAARLPVPLKIFWLLLIVAGFSAAAIGAVAAGMANEFQWGMDALILGLLSGLISLRQFTRREMCGWWVCLVRPLLVILFLTSIVFSAVELGSERNPRDEQIALTCLIVVPTILIIVASLISPKTLGLDERPRPRTVSLSGPSPKLRMPATLFTCFGFAGMGGLQRFYVGRIWTGLLWLCTYGLFGIGTIFDLIMICMGEFRDSDGRKLLAWNSLDEIERERKEEGGKEEGKDQEAANVIPRSSIPHSSLPARRTHMLVAALGYAVLVPAVFIGAVATLRVPSFIAAGLPEPSLAGELQHAFGFAGWPGFVQSLGIAIACIMMVVAAVLLIIARREAGVAHVSRATLGILGLASAGLAAYLATEPLNWINIFGQPQNLQKLSEATQSIDSGKALATALALFAGLILLAWPETRRADQGMSKPG